MAKPGTTHVIEIETGIGEPAFIPLTVGQELQPISVGKKGMWRIESARVLDVHAFVYFDGTSLFLQSADESQAASVDGYRVGKAWTELHAPCKIEVGAARLRFRSLSDNTAEMPQQQQQAPVSVRPAAGMPAPPPPPSVREDTRVGGDPRLDSRPLPSISSDGSARAGMAHHSSGAPVQAIPQGQHPAMRQASNPLNQTLPPPHLGGQPYMSPMMAAGNGTMDMPHMPPMHAGTQAMHHASGPPAGGPPAGGYGNINSMSMAGLRRADTVASKPDDGIVAKYKELNPQKRLLVLMAPFCLIASAYLLLFDDEVPPAPPVTNAVKDAGTTAPSVSTVAVLPTATIKCPVGYIPYTREVNGAIPCVPAGTPLPPPTTPTAPPTIATPVPGTASNGTAPTTAPQPTTAPTPAGGRDAQVPNNPTPPQPVAAGKTLERQAVDAVAMNDYARAAALYEQLLAQSNPKNPAYAEAARILRQKAAGGAPP